MHIMFWRIESFYRSNLLVVARIFGRLNCKLVYADYALVPKNINSRLIDPWSTKNNCIINP